ncbi:MAG: type VI secretion system ATPase TssH [Pseudomonadota bacterium]
MNISAFIKKLNPVTVATLEQATQQCLQQRQQYVEIEHWLMQLLATPQSVFCLALAYYQVNHDELLIAIRHTLARINNNHVNTPSFSDALLAWLKQAWIFASTECHARQVHSGHLLYTLCAQAQYLSLTYLEKIDTNDLRQQLPRLLAQSAENDNLSEVSSKNLSSDSALAQFTIDLTEQAQKGKLDPVIGRETEIAAMIDVLSRRRQNNPLLVGEAGVGKTAVVEGLALAVTENRVPDCLKNIRLLSLDIALLEAGAGVQGEFQSRIKQVINEVQSSATPIILFIDEAHLLVGSGNASSQHDAANILKPALARGELRTIAATTWSEYKKYIEKDAALSRRFQVIRVNEPDQEQAVAMLQGMVKGLASHHQVRIAPAAIQAAVCLSQRYIIDRQLPDKAVSLLDTACARVRLSQTAEPLQLQQAKAKLQTVTQQLEQLQEILSPTAKQRQASKDLIKRQRLLDKEIKTITTTWQKQLSALTTWQQSTQQSKSVRQQKEKHFLSVQLPAFVYHQVDEHVVADVVANWTGIPLGKIQQQDKEKLLQLQSQLARRVIGQTTGIQRLAESLQCSHAKLTDPCKPLGVFLFAGPSGVGKTETALALAEALYGSEAHLVTLNMSEYQEAHKVASLIGSPPGYVGYGEGGKLTEAVRRRPYSVVLLDEMEKAHPSVQQLFLQVFDKGTLVDSEGIPASFKDTVIIITTNASATVCNTEANEEMATLLYKNLQHTFKPEFLGRVEIIPYRSLDQDMLRKIIARKLQLIAQRMSEHHQIALRYSDDLINHIYQQIRETGSGARNIDKIINQWLMPGLSKQLLTTTIAARKTVQNMLVNIDDERNLCYEFGV